MTGDDRFFALREWAQKILSSDVNNLNTECAAHDAVAALAELETLRDMASRMWLVDPPQCMLASGIDDPKRCPDHDPPKCPGCRAHEAEQRVVRVLAAIDEWKQLRPYFPGSSSDPDDLINRVREILTGGLIMGSTNGQR